MAHPGRYKMGTLSRLSGFAPALLRAWESRHGLLAPERTPKGHRLYTEDDVRVLRRVRDLLAQGRAIGEVALLGRAALLAESGANPVPPDGPAPVTRLDELRNAVVRAALALDAPGLDGALGEAFALVAPERALRDVVEGAAATLGDLWSRGECGVASEHLASVLFARRLQRLLAAYPAPAAAPPVLCACLPDELHELGLLMAAYRLARQGLRVVYLGPNLPFEDLERACESLRPRAAYLSVTLPETFAAHRRRLGELLRRRSGDVGFVLGGRGLPADAEEALGTRARAFRASALDLPGAVG